MIKQFTFLSFFLMMSYCLLGQNTVGLISYDIDKSYDGYTLIYPHNQPTTFLLNNCGEIAHSWPDSTNFRPGNTAYLLPNGNLVRAKRRSTSAGNDPIWAGGGGEIIEMRTWDNELLWSFEMNDSLFRLHHDIEVLPNGNILAIAWELKTYDEAVAAGRDTTTLNQINLWPDFIFEINPNNDEIVWEWHAWDHLIQDFDETKENFGVVSDHPELIDINWNFNNGGADWLHSNALDYNAELDQIMLSVPNFSELWIIDHSTSTAQAASHVGGNINHGGDLLYRVGNQQAYKKGDETDQILFYQHDTHWANEFLPEEHPFSNSIVCFNNRVTEDHSTIEIFNSSWSMYANDYEQVEGTFPPYEFENTITHPDPTQLYSTGLSSAQLLPNGNILACNGRTGYLVELSPDNEVVWEYVTPLLMGQAVDQGAVLELNNNLTFRAFRYPLDYEAFDGRDLSFKGFIETMPDEDYCDQFVATMEPVAHNVSMFPTIANDMIQITWESGQKIEVEVYDIMGRLSLNTTAIGGRKYLDVSQLETGIYFVVVDKSSVRKLIIQRT